MHKDIIQDIRKRCRLAMNGVASTSMRAYGLNYKLNFGVSLPKIKEIASHYKQDKDLAESLWKEDTRELKIIATLLYPVEDFNDNTARRWIKEIPNQEIREQICFNLMGFSPDTYRIGTDCANDNNPDIRASGYWFLGRYLLINGFEDKIDLSSLEYIWADAVAEYSTLRNAAVILLKNLGKVEEKRATDILERLSIFENSENPLEAEVYHSLAFDYDFHYGRL